MSARSRAVLVERWGEAPVSSEAHVAVEEPLEIRIAGDRMAITMRTPGHDRELVLGLLWAEGLIGSLSDIASISHCGRLGDPRRENTIDVIPSAGARPELDAESTIRRGTLTTSACGVCGRQSIEDLLARMPKVMPLREPLRRSSIASAMSRLRDHQPLFARTGGCHAAGLFKVEGEHVATFEDVGRHNALDKLIGAMLLGGALPLGDRLLVVSGRASFEIVQKAAMAGIAAIASVSAPSSLAVELAESAGVTLIGFVRGDSMSVYCGRDRVVG